MLNKFHLNYFINKAKPTRKNVAWVIFSRGAADWKKKIAAGFNSRGFTFIETLAALFVIMIGISSFVSLINQSISYTKSSSYNLIAAYLSKEGIELVKNYRDSNFLKAAADPTGTALWTDGLLSCGSGCQADYDDTSFQPFNGAILKLPQSGAKFYNYSNGTDTIFKRRITINPVGAGPDYFSVKVDVIWSEKGRNHVFTVHDNLYPWY